MDRNFWFLINAVFGSVIVTVGLWLLVGELPIVMALILALGLAGLLAWKCPTIAYVWTISTFLLGLESLGWPVLQMADLQKLGPEPPLEDLQRIFTAVLFGLFSGVFWMTFSYGIYKRTRAQHAPPKPSENPSPSGKKKKSKNKR